MSEDSKSSGNDNKLPEKSLIPIEVAEKDVNRFLDAKKYGQTKRDNYRDNIDTMVDAVRDGQLVVEQDGTLKQILLFEPGENSPVKELQYKNRISFKEVQPLLKGIKPGDTESKLIAYASALTNKPMGLLRSLDTSDMSVLQTITVFFL